MKPLNWLDRAQRMIRLGELQTDLRTRTKNLIGPKGSVSTLVSRIQRDAERSVNWGMVNDFLNGEQAITSETIVRPLTDLLDAPQLRDEIFEQKKGLTDRQIGLSVCDPAAINLTYRLIMCYEKYRKVISQADFSTLFGEHQQTVADCMNQLKSGLAGLEDPGIRTAIELCMYVPDLNERVTAAAQAKRELLAPKIAEVQALVDRLRSQAPSLEQVAKKLGVHAGTLQNVKRGDVAEETIDRILKAGEALIKNNAKKSTTGESLPPSSPRSGPSSAEKNLSTIDEILNAYGGEISPLGLDFELTQTSFQKLSSAEIPLASLRMLAVAGCLHARTLRGILNVIAQLVESGVDQKHLKDLQNELAGLVCSLQALSAQAPSRITPLLDNQRQTWLSQTNARTTKEEH